jgi:quercetin dioxygenase-like cupin family protein
MNNMSSSLSQNIDELIDYRTDSVVSRIIVKSPSCNITLFSFDKGQLLTEHKTPYQALVHVLEGECNFILNGENHVLKAGCLLLMEQDAPHSLTAVEKFKMMLTMIKS